MASARLVARHRAGAMPGVTLAAGGALVVPVQGDGVALFHADSLVRAGLHDAAAPAAAARPRRRCRPAPARSRL
jgi:hypothetical protein